MVNQWTQPSVATPWATTCEWPVAIGPGGGAAAMRLAVVPKAANEPAIATAHTTSMASVEVDDFRLMSDAASP